MSDAEKSISAPGKMEIDDAENLHEPIEVEAEIVRKDAELEDKIRAVFDPAKYAYILSLLLESRTGRKTRTTPAQGCESWEHLQWWFALHQRLQCNYLTATLAGPTAIIKDWIPEPVPYEPGTFDLFFYDDDWCVSYLRFTKRQICELCMLLDIPDRFEYGCRAPPTTALSLVLYRLAYPKRLKDCMELFGHERSWLSWVFNGTCQHIYRRFHDKLQWDHRLLSLQALDRYCTVIQRGGKPTGRIGGFIDGTHRKIARPHPESAPQEKLYSAYKKSHTMQYLAVVTPDGLLACVRGPYEGRMSDWGMYKDGMDDILRKNAFDCDGDCNEAPITNVRTWAIATCESTKRREGWMRKRR
jgi:hypothetical protein